MATKDPETEAEILDEEIEALKAQVSSLKRKLKVQSSTLLAGDAARSAIQASSKARNPARVALLDHTAKHRAHIQQCLYRIASSITAFKVQDPDPNAVDGGHVLGLRFEIMSRGQFLKPYYVMLNRPYPNSTLLRVHRHTVPPAVPLAGLAARHLPEARADGEEPKPQDLERFARALRREIVRYHNRLGVSADLRRALGLQDPAAPPSSENAIVNVGLADIEAKQIELTWADERSGRLVMDDDGKVVKLAVFGKQGRDWTTTSQLFEKNDRIEDVVQKIQDYAAG
ncbi:hypothetical protein NLU13_4158 [Sarocladium strictum]|uniref:Cenp-O kinetochore centromere component n=1 Tax=Sarocladium strictum TaxID=5046 RepID=A0AA39GJQ8_SARSR|nr:hypothetical protein NLU13_4158 [Sarocladium strictum]